MHSKLSDLPPELLTHIVSHIEHAQTHLHLSLTCKRLYRYTNRDGWRVFVQNRFPSIQTPPYWKDAAHALTSLSRAWDRKAFIARAIEPDNAAVRLPNGSRPVDHGRRQRGQTMGYQPVIDSYESFTGASWTSRKEVLCWGAGAELNLRIRGMGDEVEKAWQEASIGRDRLEKYDQHHHKINWAVYKENHSQEGRDDITSVNLLRTSQRQEDSSEYVVVGRASGGLQCLRLLPEKNESEVVAGYKTENRPVRGATVSPSTEPLLAACLTDGTVAIYPVTHNKAEIEPLGELEIIPPDKPGRTWSARFLSQDRLAVGIGPSPTPLHIYQINEAGIHPTPLRQVGTFDSGITVYDSSSAHRAPPSSGSIYSLTPLPPSSLAGGSRGDLLLSGWYDGCIRQHDTRAPTPTTALYADPIDGASPIYSLLALGRERFIAGGARHSILKIFDLRMPGGKAYYAADLEACFPRAAPTLSDVCCDYHYQGRYDRRNWNIFLHPRGPGFGKLGSRRSAESPVYSLSAPAASAPWVYAGVEGAVVQFEVVGMMDRFPDPVFGFGRAKSGGGGEGVERGGGGWRAERGGGGWRAERGGWRGRAESGGWRGRTEIGVAAGGDSEVRRRWDPSGDVMRLAVYEQVSVGNMRLRVQSEVGHVKGEGVKGWDERWV